MKLLQDQHTLDPTLKAKKFRQTGCYKLPQVTLQQVPECLLKHFTEMEAIHVLFQYLAPKLQMCSFRQI